MRRLLFGLCFIGVVGCQSGQIPDPNDPSQGDVSPLVLKANLASVSTSLLERRLKQQITTDQYKELVAKAAKELVDDFKLRTVRPGEAWHYAEVLRAANYWEAADVMLDLAVRHAKDSFDEDRRINDTLRRAHVKAEMGQVDEALALVEETMNARPADSAPILPAVFYEIVKPASGKGKDYELAVILERAVDKHLLTTVDKSTDAGKAFVRALPHHVYQALHTAAGLYSGSGHSADAERCLARANAAQKDIGSLIAEARGRAARSQPEGAQAADQRRL